MVLTVVFEVKGKPAAQALRMSKARNLYLPEHVRVWRYEIAAAAKLVRPPSLLCGALSLSLEVCVPIPKGWSQVKKARARSGEIHPVSKPDLKNYLAAVEDTLTGIIYRDDSQIVKEALFKRYCDDPGIRVVVEEINGGG